MPNRTICEVLSAMRDCDKTRNYSYLLGLIEEAQNLANRMEAGLWDQKAFVEKEQEYQELKKEVKKLEAKKRKSQG